MEGTRANLLDHERANRVYWDRWSDEYQAIHGREISARPDAWGMWRVPETDLHVLPEVNGLQVLELGCGGGQWSIWLAERNACVTGLDISGGQLRHARAAAEAASIRPSDFLLTARRNGKLIGVLWAEVRDAPPFEILVPRRHVFVNELAVSRAHQRQGVGTVLMKGVHDWARANGAEEIELNVHEFNEGAIAFYEALGYQTGSRRMRVKL